MALTESTMMKLGTTAPDFNLPDTISGKKMSLSQLSSQKATVILFICNHCPYVMHIRDQLVEVTSAYQKKGIQFIAISSNDIEEYPDDSPKNMKKLAQQSGFSFPYLFDETQAVAKAYDAACTPDFFIFDKKLHCVYRGRFDESTPGRNVPVTGKDLTNALDAILAGNPINPKQKPSMGCNIKWKSGYAPSQ